MKVSCTTISDKIYKEASQIEVRRKILLWTLKILTKILNWVCQFIHSIQEDRLRRKNLLKKKYFYVIYELNHNWIDIKTTPHHRLSQSLNGFQGKCCYYVERRPQALERRQPLQAGKSKAMHSPWRPPQRNVVLLT